MYRYISDHTTHIATTPSPSRFPRFFRNASYFPALRCAWPPPGSPHGSPEELNSWGVELGCNWLMARLTMV